MFDLIGALMLGAILVADMTVVIGLAAIRPAARVAAFVIAGTWASLIFAIAAAGGFGLGTTGYLPAPVIAFLALMTGGLAGWARWPAFRNALLSLPLAGLVGINAFRIGGVSFLILHSQGRLAAPFAISAGWGDIVTGLAAIPLAIMAARKGYLPRRLLTVWTAFGALDLITAIALGALSAPGTPFRLFTEAPGTLAMGTLPWVGVPTLLVPLYLMTHLTIAARMRAVGTGQVRSVGQVENQPQSTPERKAA
jgi:hypothetical protein